MIDEKINKSLQELESQLRSISAARKQVDDTVNSFTGLKSTTSGYVESLNGISSSLSTLIDGVNKNYKSDITEFEKDRKEIIKSTTDILGKIDATTNEIQKSVQDTINSIQGKLNFIFIINIIIVLGVAYMAFVK